MIWPTFILSVESWILTVTALILVRYYLYRKWQYLADLNIPHNPPSIMKFGNTRDVFGKKMFTRDVENKSKFGLIYGEYAWVNPSIVIHDLDMLRQIYTKQFSSFTERQQVLTKMFGKDMNRGLTVAKGKTWKRMRSTLSPLFSISKIKHMVSFMDPCIDQTVAVLQQKYDVSKGEFTAKSTFSDLSLDIISCAALGADAQSQLIDGKHSRLSQELKKTFNSNAFASVAALVCFIFPFTERIFEKFDIGIFPSSALKFARNFTNDMIKKRKESQKRVDLLQLLLDSEVPEAKIDDCVKGITRQEVIGNAILMVGAGYENTANTMTFLAYNLAHHPDVQSRLQKEVDDTYEKGGFTYETVNSMKYLEMCLNESMRLYCPVLVNSRICQREITINGLTIPKGMQVNIPTFGLCHDPDYWEKPWEFNPERMADIAQIDPMVFQPFGAGPRNCIGLRFALTEIKLTFCKILKEFSLEPTEDTPKPPLKLSFSVGVKPAIEFSLRAVSR